MDIKDTIIGIVVALIGVYYLLPVFGIANILGEKIGMFLPIILVFLGGYTFFVSFSTETSTATK